MSPEVDPGTWTEVDHREGGKGCIFKPFKTVNDEPWLSTPLCIMTKNIWPNCPTKEQGPIHYSTHFYEMSWLWVLVFKMLNKYSITRGNNPVEGKKIQNRLQSMILNCFKKCIYTTTKRLEKTSKY